MNISSEKSEYCVCLCPLYIVLALCGISLPNPSTCHYFRSNLESQCLKLFQVWLHCNILYNRCLFSQRCKCTSMYKGKQIEFLKEKKDQNWCTLNRHNKKKMCNINFINKQFTAKQTEPSPIVTTRSCFIKLQ